MRFKWRLVVVEQRELGPSLNLVNVVMAWMVHVMRRRSYHDVHHLKVVHLAYLLEVTVVDDVVQILHDICRMDLIVVKVVTIRLLQVPYHILVFFLIQLRQRMFPVQLMVDIAETEDKQVPFQILIYFEGVIFLATEVRIEGL